MLEELKRMYRFKLEPVREGHCDTIADVYNDVILENELDRDVVTGWWNCLREYALSDDALVFVRKLEHEGRRGFVSRFSNGFGYVFCDNSLAKCIYALARQNIVPTPDQFRECVRASRLPCLMKTNGDEIGNPACVFCKGSKPSLGGRKLAHILSTNKDYSVDYSEFQARYFSAGDLTDWRFDNDFGYYTRRMGMLSPCCRRIFVAHFLRFTNPMNHFLFPLKRRMGVVDFGKDLSEHYDMTDFMRYVRYEQYRVFREFEKEVLYSHRARATYEVLGGERVDLSYGPMREERDNAEVRQNVRRRRNGVVDRNEPLFATRIRGMITPILCNRPFTEDEIRNFQNREFSKRVFNLNYPLLATDETRITRRYYSEPIRVSGHEFYLCNDWYPRSEEFLSRWMDGLDR